MMNSTIEHRRHLRLAHRAKVLLSRTQESIVAYTRDLSNSGVYVLGSFDSPPLMGEIMEVQLLDIDDAIARKVIVRRVDGQVGFAVEFCE